MGHGPRIKGIRYRCGHNEYAEAAAAIVMADERERRNEDLEDESLEEKGTSEEVENIIEKLMKEDEVEEKIIE